MVELETINLLVQIVGVSATAIAAVVGVSSYINSNKRSQETRNRELETRQAQMFMNIYQQTTSKDFTSAWNTFMSSQWENYREYRELYQKKEFANASMILGMYWEGLGVLVKEGFLPIRLVALLITGMTRAFWEKLKPINEEARVDMGYVRWMSETEYLYDELLRYIDEHPELSTEFKEPDAWYRPIKT